ncbi:hypothetical protein [Limnoglobus roseus]|uniref:SMI1/KNR4 family protein n=1 Tax=Limnoglobus roseus TaxID=2598579 RepID=A0A5C1AE90_9BACT|nr:hypothetical protein [Limnoglobus roseus]QEL16563.1 hypothetical protein PX52LOC_03523 [Limnoglobus roseus]
MTEAEWLSERYPGPMLTRLKSRVSARKARLLAVACCRRVWDVMIDDRCRRAVELAERSADELVDESVLDRASGEAGEAYEECLDHWEMDQVGAWPEGPPRFGWEAHEYACSAASYVSNTPRVRDEDLIQVFKDTLRSAPAESDEGPHYCNLIRDVLGNPFHPVAFNRTWLTSTVVSLAEGIYADRAFDRLPILADALQDAGCENEDILAHCRGDGPHVRGCWVVDLVLGKS